MSKIFLIFVAISLFLFVGCDDKGVPPVPVPELGPILPLSVGNIWSGTQKTYYGNNMLTDTIMYYIIDSVRINENDWFLLDLKRSGTHIHYRWVSYREDSGVHMAHCDSPLNPDECEMVFKYPALIGDSYCAHFDEDTLMDSVLVTNTDGRFSYQDSSYTCCNYAAQCCKGDTLRIDTLIDTLTADPLMTDTTIYPVIFADFEMYSFAHGLGFAQIVEWNDYKYIIWTLDTAIIMVTDR